MTKKYLYFVVLSFFLVSCSTFLGNKQKSKRDLASKYSAEDSINLLESKPDALNYISFLKILYDNQFDSIYKLLEYISNSKDYSYFLNNYTLAYSSGSLHGSSHDNPRAIVFGNSGELILTFNGEPGQRAYDKLEISMFNRGTSNFNFFEVTFRENSNQAEPFTFSSAGGPDNKCMGCHTNSKPIWDSYDIWPGIYGAIDGEPLRHSQKHPEAGLSPVVNVFSDAEKLKWKRFLTLKEDQNSRYSFLPERNFSQEPFKPENMPNTNLNNVLNRLNVKRIKKIIESYPPLAKARYIDMLYAASCPTLNSSLLEKYKEKLDELADIGFNQRVYNFTRLSNEDYFDIEYINIFLVQKKIKNFDFIVDPEAKAAFGSTFNKYDQCFKNNFMTIRDQIELNTLCQTEVGEKLFEGVDLNKFFRWAIKNSVLKTPKIDIRVSRVAAIFETQVRGLSTKDWSSTFLGSHDYNGGTDVHKILMHNMIVNFVKTRVPEVSVYYKKMVDFRQKIYSLQNGVELEAADRFDFERAYCKDLEQKYFRTKKP